MRPTFFGFEAAKSGLTAAQAGLDTTGNRATPSNRSVRLPPRVVLAPTCFCRLAVVLSPHRGV